MKKLALFLTLSCSMVVANAQISIPKEASSAVSSFVKPPAIRDIGKTTTGIMDMLGKSLSLTGDMKPKLTDAISGFLGQKKGIIGLADSNPADYLKKFNPLQQGLFGKMKTILGATMFSQFMGLKPSGSNVAGNLLSNLFF